MAEFHGTVELISGITPKNGGDFALVGAHDVQIDNDGNRLDTEFSNLKSALDNNQVETTKTINWSNGYINSEGVVTSSSKSGYAVVPLQSDETVVIGTKNTTITIIGSTTEETLAVGDRVTVIQRTSAVNQYEEYSYTATENINITLCVNLAEYNVRFYKKFVQTDKTLSLSDVPADAAIVGNGFEEVENGLDEITETLDSIIVTKIPKNYFVFSGQPWHTSDVVASYNEHDITLTFTETANPTVCFIIPNLIAGKTYDISFDITNGTINENRCYIRRYIESNPHNGETIASFTFTDHKGSTSFTVPRYTDAATLELPLVYNSKSVTISNMSVTESGDQKRIEVCADAMNRNSVGASFVYSPNTGDCTILDIHGDTSDKIVMIDCLETTQAGRNNIIAALNKDSIAHIDYFILSHYHLDHCGNIQWLIDGGYFDSTTIFVFPEDVPSTSEGLNREDNGDRIVIQRCVDIREIIENLGATIIYPQEDDILTVNDCIFKFWNCDHSEYYAKAWVDYNECSLCCAMIYGEMVVHFTGDIGPDACRKYYDKLYKCNIFKANHHSCGYPVVPKFMSAIFPDIVVSMTGSNVIYSTDPSVQAVFATLSNGLQTWCETEFVPNYVTGVIQNNIYMTITKHNFRFDSNVRRCVRADEDIPAS